MSENNEPPSAKDILSNKTDRVAAYLNQRWTKLSPKRKSAIAPLVLTAILAPSAFLAACSNPPEAVASPPAPQPTVSTGEIATQEPLRKLPALSEGLSPKERSEVLENIKPVLIIATQGDIPKTAVGCTANLLENGWVVTALHCFDEGIGQDDKPYTYIAAHNQLKPGTMIDIGRTGKRFPINSVVMEEENDLIALELPPQAFIEGFPGGNGLKVGDPRKFKPGSTVTFTTYVDEKGMPISPIQFRGEVFQAESSHKFYVSTGLDSQSERNTTLPGDSGSAVVNDKGEAIGFLTGSFSINQMAKDTIQLEYHVDTSNLAGLETVSSILNIAGLTTDPQSRN